MKAGLSVVKSIWYNKKTQGFPESGCHWFCRKGNGPTSPIRKKRSESFATTNHKSPFRRCVVSHHWQCFVFTDHLPAIQFHERQSIRRSCVQKHRLSKAAQLFDSDSFMDGIVCALSLSGQLL